MASEEAGPAPREVLRAIGRELILALVEYWETVHPVQPTVAMMELTRKMLADAGLSAEAGNEVQQQRALRDLGTAFSARFKRGK